MTKALTPRTARTVDQLCTLKRDNVSTRSHWIIVDADAQRVVIHAQRNGESSTESICLPRRTFEKFIDWYNTGEWPIKKASR